MEGAFQSSKTERSLDKKKMEEEGNEQIWPLW
ncbi:hypothetical protein SAMN05216244_2216 [Sediminibacillus halophilus]|uniref:Uncharacterized protein n=1 Tax=Sediminibacillus halophilus TaxID=482461 RepID=A0A1G9RZJ2_9BACI|nr:hypothetical protein SAMN05216244_2216 [Sediminibacillus halophilus]